MFDKVNVLVCDGIAGKSEKDELPHYEHQVMTLN